jgi:hypothetical protein
MMPSKRIAPRNKSHFSASASFAALALGIALAIAPTWVGAETHVRGTSEAVVVDVQSATLEEILVALTDTFKVQFKSGVNLDRRLTGTYKGTLQQAVSHILKGYDFVVKSGEAGLEITLLGSGRPVPVGGRPATKSAESALAAPQPTPTADNANHAVPVPSSDGPAPPARIAQGPAPVPTPPASGAAPAPVPQIGPGPAPMPQQSGAAPTPAPPLPTTSSAAPPLPIGTPSTVAPPTPGAPGSAPPLPSPAR